MFAQYAHCRSISQHYCSTYTLLVCNTAPIRQQIDTKPPCYVGVFGNYIKRNISTAAKSALIRDEWNISVVSFAIRTSRLISITNVSQLLYVSHKWFGYFDVKHVNVIQNHLYRVRQKTGLLWSTITLLIFGCKSILKHNTNQNWFENSVIINSYIYCLNSSKEIENERSR